MAGFGSFIINWIDLIWFPIVWFSTAKRTRPYAMGLVLAGFLTLRLQADFMDIIGFDQGLTGWVAGLSRARGLLIYSVFTVLYLVVSYLSRRQPWPVLLSGAIVFYMAAFILSMTIMAI